MGHTAEGISQGYVTMAYGQRRFFEMAVNLALSIRLNDSSRPVTLLYKDRSELPEEHAEFFSACRPFENPDGFSGVAIKLGVYEPSPYNETFFVDADCLIMKRDMDRHWEKFGAQDFAIAGDVVRSGSAYGCDVEKMMAAAGVDYFCDMNCGVLFFRKSDKAQMVFSHARALMEERHPDLIELRSRRNDGLSDQPYFAAAMARNGIQPVSYAPQEGTIMATTWQASDIEFDLAKGVSRLQKPTGFHLLGRFWAKGWVRHETSIAHFIELKPRKTYQQVSDRLRDHFGVPRFRFD